MICIRLLAALACTLLLTNSCNRPSDCCDGPVYVKPAPLPPLVTISLIDRNGLSETISVPDRIKQYQTVNFLTSQPYQKVLRVFARNSCGDITAIVTTYHVNGQVKQYLEVVNNRAFGYYREWHENGTMKLETKIIGGSPDICPGSEKSWLFDEVSKVWNNCGVLEAEIPYCRGKLEGISIYYHPNGAIWKEECYKDGVLNGTANVYRESGTLLSKTEYIQGVKCGSAYRYWSEDKLAADEEYVNGQLTEAQYWDPCGETIGEIHGGEGWRAVFGKETLTELQQYHQGKPDGEVKVLAKNGRIIRTYHMKDGSKNGEEIEYRNLLLTAGPSTPKLSITWSNGVIQGPVKTWYENGKLESKREMSGNVKNGMLSAWYRDGSLMMIEEYDHDKLVKGEYFTRGDKFPVSTVNFGKGYATIYDADGVFIRKIVYHHGKPVEF